MKKLLSLIICAIVVMTSLQTNAVTASNAKQEGEMTVFSDGSYCITTIEEEFVSEYGKASSTKTGTKTSHYYNANNVLQFSVFVRGTFLYDGTNVTATDSAYSYSISNSEWSFVSGRSSFAANSAIAVCTFRSQNAGDKTHSAALYCSPTGVLS